MKVTDLKLNGVKLIQPDIFKDDRGFFLETYNYERYEKEGVFAEGSSYDGHFVQDNHSRSVGGVIRGLHYQSGKGQAKIVRVVSGIIFDVAVDIRPESPTFGMWVGEQLTDKNHHQMFIPAGFAHGFCVVTTYADVLYKVSEFYRSDMERSIKFDDPEIGVDWPVELPIVSERDYNAESFADYKTRILS
jgi:dTDP-4-dehydrorhamnose 3,5-epimerase